MFTSLQNNHYRVCSINQSSYPQRTELRGAQILSGIMCHNRARVGKPDQIGAIYVISGMLKLFRHYVLAQAGRS